jgi:hypothetical protein
MSDFDPKLPDASDGFRAARFGQVGLQINTAIPHRLKWLTRASRDIRLRVSDPCRPQ